MRGRADGFSLLELLIVVAIILIIATIAIPSFLRSRQNANETAAVANLRSISNAEATYSISSGGRYLNLTGLVNEGLLDDRFNAGVLSGYSYSMVATSFSYTVVATPFSNSGRYGFYLVADGVIRYSTQSALAPPGKAAVPVN
jgi:prepilin-type N-terminal cleavage/methylation domain-containing protein